MIKLNMYQFKSQRYLQLLLLFYVINEMFSWSSLGSKNKDCLRFTSRAQFYLLYCLLDSFISDGGQKATGLSSLFSGAGVSVFLKDPHNEWAVLLT